MVPAEWLQLPHPRFLPSHFSPRGLTLAQILLLTFTASTITIAPLDSQPMPVAVWGILYNQMKKEERAHAWVMGGQLNKVWKDCKKERKSSSGQIIKLCTWSSTICMQGSGLGFRYVLTPGWQQGTGRKGLEVWEQKDLGRNMGMDT